MIKVSKLHALPCLERFDFISRREPPVPAVCLNRDLDQSVRIRPASAGIWSIDIIHIYNPCRLHETIHVHVVTSVTIA